MCKPFNQEKNMALPGVDIDINDGALGRSVATDDGVAGLVLTGIAATGLALNVAKKINTLAEAIALGITAVTLPHAYAQLAGFYKKAGDGAELWFMLVSEATTNPDVFVLTTGPMDKLLEASQGRITIAGTSMGRAGGYTATPTGILDYNIGTVATAAQALAVKYANRFAPVRIILDGTYLIDPLTGITTIKGAGDRVGVFLGVTETGKRAASMGEFLGQLAVIPVHQSIARVKSGPFSANAFLTSGKAIESYPVGTLDSLHDSGYMALRGFLGVFGAYVTDDLTLAAPTSDYTSLARGRVIDKAIRLTYQTYVYELNDTIEIGNDGKLLPTKVSYIEDVITRALSTRMLAEGNCSAVAASVDPAQNVLATDTIEVVVKITPLGYLKDIIVKLGFANPASA